MNENLRQPGCPPSAVFSPHSLAEVCDTWPDNKPPAFIPKTVLCRVEGKHIGVVRLDRVTNEATSGVSVKADHEKECKVMGVPECLEALVADLVVGSSIHEQHDEKHEVSRDTASLSVVNIKGGLLSDL